MAGIDEYDITAGSNTSVNAINIAENCPPSGINNAIRQVMADMRRFANDIGAKAVSSGTDTITLTTETVLTAYADGTLLAFIAGGRNTGAATLNVDSVGAKPVLKDGGVALAAGDIVPGQVCVVAYDASADAASGAWLLVNPVARSLPPGHLHGLTLSNNSGDATNDIDIAVGSARSDDDEESMALAAALTKRLDAGWAVGSGNGGLDTGSIANATYHIWLIKRTDTGVVDALFSTSASSPTMPTNYNYKRRIGSIVRTGGAIKAFTQRGDHFTWSVPVQDADGSSLGTSAITQALTVPDGIVVDAVFYAGLKSVTASITTALVTALTQADSTPSESLFHLREQGHTSTHFAGDSGRFEIATNTSRQIRYRLSASSSSINFSINTVGWIDTRGRL